MKFDKDTVAMIAICAAILIGWQIIFPPQEVQEQQIAEKQTTENVEKETPAKETVLKPVETAGLKAFSGEIEPVTIENEELGLTINPATGSVSAIALKDQFKTLDKKENIALAVKQPEMAAFSFTQANLQLVAAPKVTNEGTEITVERVLANGTAQLTVLQKWSLQENSTIDYSLKLSNPGAVPYVFDSLSIATPGIRPLSILTDVDVRIASIFIDIADNGGNVEKIKVEEDKEDFPTTVKNSNVKWVANSNKYYATITKTTSGAVKSVTPLGAYDYFSSSLDYGSITIEPGQSKEITLSTLARAKSEIAFKAFDKDASEVMHISSFGPLAMIASYLLIALGYLKGLLGSYGLAIIALTIIVRSIFWPITAKGTASMKRMQAIQPLMKELKEKYKDDQQMMSKKTMELYKEHKVNPVGGCLPMLVQVPIFMAFYWGLDGAVELRHVSFLWAQDLAQPDVVATILGLPIHPLVIMMASLMFLQQKLTPSTGDPMQKNMMMAMPLVMIFFMYSMPSGLTLYWTVSNTMSIIQLLVTRARESKPKAKTA